MEEVTLEVMLQPENIRLDKNVRGVVLGLVIVAVAVALAYYFGHWQLALVISLTVIGLVIMAANALGFVLGMSLAWLTKMNQSK